MSHKDKTIKKIFDRYESARFQRNRGYGIDATIASRAAQDDREALETLAAGAALGVALSVAVSSLRRVIRKGRE